MSQELGTLHNHNYFHFADIVLSEPWLNIFGEDIHFPYWQVCAVTNLCLVRQILQFHQSPFHTFGSTNSLFTLSVQQRVHSDFYPSLFHPNLSSICFSFRLPLQNSWSSRPMGLRRISVLCFFLFVTLIFVMKYNWQIQIPKDGNKKQLSRAIFYC